MAAVGSAPRFNPWVVAMTVTLATFMEVLDTSIANVALPHIAGNLGATSEESTWVQTSYLVSNAIILPMSGWLSTRVGRKRFYMACVVLFTLSSMLCGMATTLPMLILFRVMQGLGGGGLGPSEQAILADTFTPQQRNMGFAIYGMAIVVAPAIGPTLGGWITDSYSWHWIFFINVPIGIISLFLTHRVVHDPPHVLEAQKKRGAKTDYLGITTIVIGVGLLQYVLDKGEQLEWFDSNIIRVGGAIAAIALVVMIWREWTHEHPIIQLRLLKNRNFASSAVSNFTLGVVLNGSTILIPQFLQLQLGYSAQQAGMASVSGRLCAGAADAGGGNPGKQIRSAQGDCGGVRADLGQHVLDDAHNAGCRFPHGCVDAGIPGRRAAADFHSHQHARLCRHAAGRQ